VCAAMCLGDGAGPAGRLTDRMATRARGHEATTSRPHIPVRSMFRRSELMGAKWDAPRGDPTYGALTIATALGGGGALAAQLATDRRPLGGDRRRPRRRRGQPPPRRGRGGGEA
jgi:hypothetical protein